MNITLFVKRYPSKTYLMTAKYNDLLTEKPKWRQPLPSI